MIGPSQELGGPLQPPDFDQHYATSRQTRTVASYDCYPDQKRLELNTPPWGATRIGDWPGDELLVELFQQPLIQRQAGTELLSLPRHYMTMPDTDDLPLLEHSCGMMVLTRQLIEKGEERGQHFTDRDRLILQATALLHDVGKEAHAHLIDWYRQGFDGPQDSHDNVLAATLQLSGIDHVLQQQGISVEEVLSSEKSFMGSSGPELNTDRVDYGVREILRWVDPGSDQFWQHAFSLDEQGRIIMQDKVTAKRFGIAYGLLATEHWGHPIHQLQLQLFSELIKSALLSDDTSSMHVLDRMRTLDSFLVANTRQIGPLNNSLHALMLNIARDQRRVFAWGKESEITDFLGQSQHDILGRPEQFLHPLEERSWRTEYSGVKPQNISLLPPAEVRDFGERSDTLDVYLPPMKMRTVDPLYYDAAGNVRRLSEADQNYAALMSSCRAIQREDRVARIHLAPDAAASLKDTMLQVQIEWSRALSQPRTESSRQQGEERLQFLGPMAGSLSLSRYLRVHH